MHYLHAILVNVEEILGRVPQPGEYEDVKAEARSVAMSETDQYSNGNVFDWRTEENAGRWSDLYPGIDVILGAEDRERFLAEFLDWKDKPLKNALSDYAQFSMEQTSWLTKEEIDEYNRQARQEGRPELVVNSDAESLLIFEDIGSPQKYYAGIPLPDVVINRNFLCQAWENKYDSSKLWLLKTILQLVNGDYKTDSQFYSLPDCSSKVSKETSEDVLAHPEKYALVFCDYHN